METEKTDNSLKTHVNNKQLWFSVLAIAVLVVLIGASWSTRDKNQAPTEEEVITTTENTPVITTESIGSQTPPPASSTAESKNLSYEEAVATYTNRNIRFNNACQATPSQQTVAVDTRILLDNNSTETKIIKIADKTYTLRPYHYATLKLSTAGTFLVSCNEVQSAATVVVQ